jgi:[pyruvate, water dikinase]-phosphate phosphotransferase / [pyruvate, water dikinase] kinase
MTHSIKSNPSGRGDTIQRVSKERRGGLTIFVVSDATGETAERVVRSALVQFENAPVVLIRRGFISTADEVRAVLMEASEQDSLVLHTLVSDELRRVMLAEARTLRVDAMDLMGPVLDRLVTHLHLTPQEKPGLFKQLVEAQSRQIEAVEFAFRHDDGQYAEEMDKADIILVGVSRTMKTPTMLYLAYKGWFCANIPLVLGIPQEPMLEGLPPERIYCLLMTPVRLLELRRARADHLRLPAEPYASLESIRQEIGFTEDLCRRHAWRRIDVTGKSVEEVAQEILVLCCLP